MRRAGGRACAEGRGGVVHDGGSDRIGWGGVDVRPSRENSCELLTLSENTAPWNSLIFTRVAESICGNWPGNERGKAGEG